MNKKEGSAPIAILLVVLGILAAGGIWYYEAYSVKPNRTTSNQISISVNENKIVSFSSESNKITIGGNTCTPFKNLSPRFPSTGVNAYYCNSSMGTPASKYYRYLYVATGTYQIAPTAAGVFEVMLRPGTVVLENTDYSIRGWTSEYGEICGKDFCPYADLTVGTTTENFQNFTASIEKQYEPRQIAQDFPNLPLFQIGSMGGYKILGMETIGDMTTDHYPPGYADIYLFGDNGGYFKIGGNSMDMLIFDGKLQKTKYVNFNSLKGDYFDVSSIRRVN